MNLLAYTYIVTNTVKKIKSYGYIFKKRKTKGEKAKKEPAFCELSLSVFVLQFTEASLTDLLPLEF